MAGPVGGAAFSALWAVVALSEPVGSDEVLLGRDHELQTLGALLDAVSSQSRSVVVHGEAGQGKSSLLRWTTAAAERRGLTTLAATGVEFERELAFSGLTAVLRPLGPRFDRATALTPAQRDALEVAMGFAAGEAPPLRTYGATLELLSSVADDTPVVVAVDDAHWIDQASLEALLFAAQRAGVDRVGFVFAQRAGMPCLLDHTGFDRIELSDLPRDVASALLVAEGVVPPVADRCWELTGGNPLALLEGARGLTDRQRSGADPLPHVLPAATRLLGVFQERLGRLPEATVRALGLAALETSNDMTVVATALRAAGRELADLEPAELDHLVGLAGGRLTWHHPLLRSAVHQRIDGRWRREAHRALARAEQSVGHDDTALWHLSETIVGPDDDVADQMASLAAVARRRGAPAAAAEAYLQASRLATDTVHSDRHLLAAADARWATGDLLGTTELLTSRIAGAAAEDVQAQMAMVLGQAELWTIGTSAAIERYERAAAAVAEARPVLAAFLLVHAATAWLVALDGPKAVEAAERALAFAERSGDPAVLFGASAMHTLTRLFAGDTAWADDRLRPISQLTLAALDTAAEGADDLAQVCAFGFLASEQWFEAKDLLHRVIRLSESSGMAGRGAFARHLLAEALWRTGRWAEGLAELTQSVTLQEAIRPGQVVPGTLSLMARFEAGFGHVESCQAYVAQVLGQPPDIEMFSILAHSAIGLLELGLGNSARAARAFDEIVDRTERIGEPGWLWWQGDAIDAYAGCRRTDDARRELDRLDTQAAATGRGWARSAAARGHGLLAADDDADKHFTAALEGFRSLGAPFEEARTLLVRGQRRIAHGAREAGARDIAAARTIFDRLSARTWSERASAIRGEVAGADDSLTSRLTPAELRVAIAVGHGSSNREAADQLFISTKTVDYHLQNIYRKLGLRSRTQLMSLVLTDSRD